MGVGLSASPKEDLTVMALGHYTVCRWVLQRATVSRHLCDLRQVSSLVLSSWGPVLLSTSVSLSIKKGNPSPGWCEA